MNPKLKNAIRTMAQHTLGRLPPPSSRLTGELAVNGGKPVRDLRLRPWQKQHLNHSTAWFSGVGKAFKNVFLSGQEGLPQNLAKEFAAKWAARCGVRHALLLPHGTDALRIGLAAALDHDGLDYGGEVIVPNLSFIASATAPLDRRFGICLVDVDPGTLLLDPAKVEEAIQPGKTRAIMPVHLFGQLCDMTALESIAKKHGLIIIEDAAQSHSAEWSGRHAGAWGAAGGFSFQSHKNLNSGEGGILTTNDDAVFERAYMIHNAGRSLHNAGRWEHLSLGWNIRPSEYQAALLLERLKGFDAMQERRRENFSRLRKHLEEVPCLIPQQIPSSVTLHGAHMFVMRYKSELCRGTAIDEFLRIAGAEGVPMYRGYASTMAAQPAIAGLRTRRPDYVRVMETPAAEEAARELVYISHEIFLNTASEIDEIGAAFMKIYRHLRSL